MTKGKRYCLPANGADLCHHPSLCLGTVADLRSIRQRVPAKLCPPSRTNSDRLQTSVSAPPDVKLVMIELIRILEVLPLLHPHARLSSARTIANSGYTTWESALRLHTGSAAG